MHIGLQSFVIFATIFFYFAILSILTLIYEIISNLISYTITILKYVGHVLGIAILYYFIYSFMFGCPFGFNWNFGTLSQDKIFVEQLKWIKDLMETLLGKKEVMRLMGFIFFE